MLTSTKRLFTPKTRKTENCLNCNYQFEKEENYCPICGQENTDKKVTLLTIIDDFAKDYFTFDSKLIRSLVPLLFKPGFLTNEYNEGKRVKYIPPLRMYIFISICYFFMISSLVNYEKISKNSKAFQSNDLGMDQAVSIDSIEQLTRLDTVMVDGVPVKEKLKVKSGATSKSTSINDFLSIAKKEGVTTDQVLDSLKMEKTSNNRLFVGQAIKLLKNDLSVYAKYVVDHLSITLFLLIPFFAAFMKLAYIRSNKLFIEHTVFTLHFQSFLFVFVMLCVFIDSYLKLHITGVLSLSIIIYFNLALKRVYQQSWRKTIFKSFILLLSYNISIVLFLIANIIVSFLMF